jgi:hypothetical protein
VRKIEDPRHRFQRGYAALQAYTSNDDVWSPSDDLMRLFNEPDVRQRIGMLIADAAERATTSDDE